jgi:hypothetical protein
VGSAVLVIIILYLLRQGNYFINGFPIFMWIYYYNYVDFKNKYVKKDVASAIEPIAEKAIE